MPRANRGIVVPVHAVSGLAFLFVDKNPSKNLADAHHALLCIIVLLCTVCHIPSSDSIDFPGLAVDYPCVYPMPTPRDSTDQLPLLLERVTHTTCPPEEDRPGQWRAEVLERLGRAALDNSLSNRARRQHDDVSIEAEGPSILESIETTHDKTSDQTSTMDLAEVSLSGDSPSSSHTDDKEVEHVQPSAPTSSALDLYHSSRLGIESHRVSSVGPFLKECHD